MNTIEINRWNNGAVIFSYECENNTVKKTVEEAVRQGISLAYANLVEQDLSFGDFCGGDFAWAHIYHSPVIGAKFIDAILYRVHLFNSNFTGSYFTNAVLYGAEVCGVDLTDATLTNINFTRGKLPRTILTDAKYTWPMFTINGLRFPVSCNKQLLQIAHRSFLIDEWDSFTDEQISKILKDPLDFWHEHKDMIITKAREINQ